MSPIDPLKTLPRPNQFDYNYRKRFFRMFLKKLFRTRNKTEKLQSEYKSILLGAFLGVAALNSCTLPGGTPIPNPSPSVSPIPSPQPSVSPSPNPSSGPSGGPTYNIQVSWRANHESAVNTTGGGYRVYYAQTPSVNTATATFLNVPYVSGAHAPTSARLTNLQAGKYYFRVVAFSALNPRSSDSAETSLTVP